MLSRKIIVLAVTSLLIMSMLSCLVFASVVCPKCHGTGKVPSASCLVCGGTGQIQPNVTSSGIALGTNQTATNFTAVYHNNEAVDVYGVATATLNTQKTTLTETSNRTLLKANSDTSITLTFKEKDQNYYQHLMDIALEPIACPSCGGTGGAGTYSTCTNCAGTGYISEAQANGQFDFSVIVLPAVGIAVVAAASAAGVFIVRKRRLTEEKIRGFTSAEFNKWVLGRLRGAEASVLDARKGIDGFTGDGTAVIAKQADNIGKIQIDSALNSIMQAKARKGIFVAYSFAGDASLAVTRGRINYRIDLKIISVKDLLRSKEPLLV